MGDTVLEEVETYITQKYKTVAQYIATRTILELCEEADWHSGEWVLKRWWDQEGKNLSGGGSSAATAEEIEDEEVAAGKVRRAEAGG